MKRIVVTGSFDDLRSHRMRFLQEASRLGAVHVALWRDEDVCALEGRAPKFPLEEREYVLRVVRYVADVSAAPVGVARDDLPAIDGVAPDVWAVLESDDNAPKRVFAKAHGVAYHVVKEKDLQGFPADATASACPADAARTRVIVTGCYDWFHSGHVRFFEEVSALGDLYVVVGNDANVRLLKGEGHPLFPEDERRYMAQSIRYVKAALVATGRGWLDAEPEIAHLAPHIYAVNSDGDKPEKREFCRTHGLEYVVLERTPREGLSRRSSTDLRGF
jgi:cytidyltransferase-like protein